MSSPPATILSTNNVSSTGSLSVQLCSTLAAGHSLDTAVSAAQAGACVLVGFGCGLVEGVRLAPNADARVAGAEEVGALLADGEVVGGLVGAGLGEAGCGGGGQDEKGCQLHVCVFVYESCGCGVGGGCSCPETCLLFRMNSGVFGNSCDVSAGG